MAVEFEPFDISEHLDSEEMIAGYLSAAAEDDDPNVLLGALLHAAKARGLIEVARAASCAMPRDALTLADVRSPTLSIVCERCRRRGRYNVKGLIAVHGADMRLPELLANIANCEKARSFSIYDRCRPPSPGRRWRSA
jgi:probable addiction module antidote protein